MEESLMGTLRNQMPGANADGRGRGYEPHPKPLCYRSGSATSEPSFGAFLELAQTYKYICGQFGY